MKKLKQKPKLKKPVRRAARNPYARALDNATKKYDKAFLDLQRAEEKVAKLQLELPRLEQVKLSLEAFINGDAPPEAYRLKPRVVQPSNDGALAPALPELGERKPSGPLPASAMAAVPGYLAHMIKEHPAIERGSIGQAHGMVANIDIESAEESDGTELLP